MSDTHAILDILRELPEENVASRCDPALHRLEARTSPGLYEPDVVVEISHNEAHHQHTASTLRRIVLRTLEDAIASDPAPKEAGWPEMPLMASLATLAACRASDRDGMRPEITAWAPTPWCDSGVTVLEGTTAKTRQAVPQPLRARWSNLFDPTVRITDRTASEASLAVRLHPHQIVVRCDLDAMERIRLESEMASIIEGFDRCVAW